MTTFTATPDNTTGSVTLSINQTASVQSITRSNSNGVASVRISSGQLPSPSAGTTIVTDYEAAHGLNVYTVSTAAETLSQTATLTIDKPWLLVPIAPDYSEQTERVMNYSAGRETNSTVHTIIGRSDPLVVIGKLGSRTGTLEIWTASLEDASRLVRVFDRGEAVMLKQTVPGMDMYFAANSLDVEPYSITGPEDTRYKLTVNYTEVSRPYGNLAGALGWTFDALASGYASFDAVTAAFATFDDLTIQDTV
jgi:hypothetical protein